MDFALVAGVTAPFDAGVAEGFDTSPVWNKAFILDSSPGVAARLSVFACPRVGESTPERGVCVPWMLKPTGRTSIDFLPGEAGESTVTVGGEFCRGVMEIIDCGRDLGEDGRPGRGTPSAGAALLSGAKSGTSPLPDAVVGLDVVPVPLGTSHGERAATAGEVGGVPLSFSKFSNLERNEETGLIDEASGPSVEPSMLASFLS